MVIISILVVLFKIFAIILLAVLILLLLILLIPVKYIIAASLHEKAEASIQIRWALLQVLFLFVDKQASISIEIFGKLVKSGPIQKNIRKKPQKEKPETKFQIPGKALIREAIAFAKDVLKSIKPQEISAMGTYNLDDPACTALASFFTAIIVVLLPSAQIALNPSFEQETTDVDIKIAGKIVLTALLGLLIKYGLKKEVRKVWLHKRIKA